MVNGSQRRPGRSLAMAGTVLLAAFCAHEGGAAPKRFVPTYSTTARISQQLSRLDRLAQQKLWDEWLKTYQELVDLPLDPVVVQDSGVFMGVRYRCHRLLAALPAPVRQRYRLAYDGEALRLYQQAARALDPAGMREVYSRYRYSTYGPRALEWVGDRALDRGQYGLAYLTYHRLTVDGTPSPAVLLHLAAAAEGAGHKPEAAAALSRVRTAFAKATVQLGSAKMTGIAAADTLSRMLAAAPVAEPALPLQFAGADGTRRMAAPQPGSLQPAWTFQYPTAIKPSPPFNGHADGNPDRLKAGFSFLSFPVGRQSAVWVQGPRSLTALDPETGRRLWTQADLLLEEAESPELRDSLSRNTSAYPYSRPVQAAPLEYRGRVFARMPLSYQRGKDDFWPSDFAIAAFDALKGTLLWRRQAGGEPRSVYYNLPAAGADELLTGLSTFTGGLTEFRATALDAGSGETLWSTYLGGGSHTLGGADGSPPLVREGEVWVESTLHTLTALDLLTGEIRLVVPVPVYLRGKDENASEGPTTNQPVTLLATSRGQILFSPRWSDRVFALDPATGKTVWSVEKAIDRNRGWSGALAAADDRRAYVSGQSVQAIDLAAGTISWTWKPKQATNNMGYPALLGDRLYVPIEGQLQILDAATGKEGDVLDLTGPLGGREVFPTLTVVGNRLLVAAGDRVIALQPN